MSFCPSCGQEHDDGDDVVVIMCASARGDGCGCVRSRDGSRDRTAGRALSADTANCWHSRDRTHRSSEVESLDC
jgi:hypothetical protein